MLTAPSVLGECSERTDSFSCEVLSSFSDWKLSREVWDTAVLALDGNIYFSYDSSRTWWDFYGKGKILRLFVCHAGDKLVAIIPTYIDSIGIGPLRLRISRLIGSNIPPKAFLPPIDEAWSVPVFQAIVKQLFEIDRCDLLSFGPLSGVHKPLKPIIEYCSTDEDLKARFEVVHGVHTIFRVPESMEAFYDGLSKQEKKNRRKYELRMLKKEFEVAVNVLSDPELVSQEFEGFVKQHTEQWRAEGKPGHFGSWPHALEFNRELVRRHGALGRMRFIRILANGEVIANQYTFAFGGAYVWELPSRAVDVKWSRFSLGPTAIVTMIEEALKESVSHVEGGLGHYEYKLRLGAEQHATTTLRVCSNGSGSRWRLRLFLAFRKVVGSIYHKIWYRRIAPRLPSAFWKPQWNLWLRLDF
jgi:hypothetical protein